MNFWYEKIMALKEAKEKGEALIMHARQYPIITEMADIDMYEDFKGHPSVELSP